MKHWLRDTFSPYFLVTMLVIVALTLVGIIAASVGVRIGMLSEDMEVLSQGYSDCNRELVIEGCDKHGDNCAPIYMCGEDE